jgi:Sec-independent protein translocase protein TatA
MCILSTTRVFLVASFVIGPQKLAEMAKGAGTAVGELQDVPKGFKEVLPT